MKQWFVLFEKEQIEQWKNFKWIWVPLVFILLGVMQPVTTYFLPQIIDSVGNLPEGTKIEFPTPSGSQVLAETLSQFNTLGLLVLVLAFMGTVAVERNSGVAGMILVKPVSFVSYITAKWAAAVSLSLVAASAGTLSAWFYTEQLIGSVEASAVLSSLLIYLFWIMFVVTAAVFFSALLKAPGAIAFVTLLLASALSILASLLGKYMEWSPGKLSSYAGAALAGGQVPTGTWTAVVCTVIATCVLLGTASAVFRNKELVG